MPIWVAVLGTLVVLGTITGTQKIMQGFMVSQSDHVIKVKYDSATDWAVNLGAYLVTNNLILCRNKEWNTTDHNTCKWNSKAPTPNAPADFELSNEPFSNGKLSYKLSTPDDVDFNLSEDIKITFRLMAWDPTTGTGELKKIIGDIPAGLCRNIATKAVEKTCVASSPATSCMSDTDCSTPLDKCVSDFCSCCDDATQTFEAISNVDGDYDVVLVEVIAGEGTSNQTNNYVGVRRPLSRLMLSFEEDPKCTLKCDVGSVASLSAIGSGSASCRSILKTDDTKVKVKVFNQGPGVLYDLSLLREARMRSKLETCTANANCRSGGFQECDKPAGAPTGVCVGRKVVNLTDIVQNQDDGELPTYSPPTCTVDVDCKPYYSDGTATTATCSSGACVTIGAILPGEFFFFEDNDILCENDDSSAPEYLFFPKWDIQTIREKLIDINNTGTLADTLSKNVNVYSEKFMELEYKLDLTTEETTGSGDKAVVEPRRIFHHGNTINLLDSLTTAFMVYEPPN